MYTSRRIQNNDTRLATCVLPRLETSTMLQPFRELTLGLVSPSARERRSESRVRTEGIQARLTDIYRERVPVVVLNLSRSGLGLKVNEHLRLNFPVLIECQGLLIIGNVRHCMKAAKSGYIAGLKIHQVVDTASWESQQTGEDSAPCLVRSGGGGGESNGLS
jgi:hypothetical protein